MKYKTIQVCLGVGSNQLFPEYTTILIPEAEEVMVNEIKSEEPKKRGRKPKQK